MNPSRADEPIATIDTVGLATVQDAGREGLTDVGVPRSGAWHRGRHRLAHALVHGTLDGPHPTLEILGSDMTLTIHQRQTLALVGPADLTVDGHRAPHAVAVDVSPATTVTIHHRGPGPAYVALSDWQPAPFWDPRQPTPSPTLVAHGEMARHYLLVTCSWAPPAHRTIAWGASCVPRSRHRAR